MELVWGLYIQLIDERVSSVEKLSLATRHGSFSDNHSQNLIVAIPI